MKTIYAKEAFPTQLSKSIFLVGPTPRDYISTSWREQAIQILEKLKFDGVVFIPEPRDGIFQGDYNEQVDWESDALNRADIIACWIPRDMENMPALTTNVEFGYWATSGKVVLGYPKDAEHMRYLQDMANKLKIPSFNSLEETLQKSIELIGPGATRSLAETEIPLLVWKHPTFQSWYKAQRLVGNSIKRAKVLWNFRAGKNKDNVFAWVLHVSVFVKEENRVKDNEFVFGRTDLASICLIFDNPETDTIIDNDILLVKEFRSPVRNSEEYVYELPGGSSKDTTEETMSIALHELKEETGFGYPTNRLKLVSSRQCLGTLSCHTNSLFVGKLTLEEVNKLKALDKEGKTFGVAEDTEITYVKVMTIRQILESNLVDWTNIGMIYSAMETL